MLVVVTVNVVNQYSEATRPKRLIGGGALIRSWVWLIMFHDVENLFSIHCLLPDVVNLWVHG